MSGWADDWISLLRSGIIVTCMPVGKSMEPIIKSGSRVTLVPFQSEPIRPGCDPSYGDIVLCTIGKKQYLHRVTDLKYGRLGVRTSYDFSIDGKVIVKAPGDSIDKMYEISNSKGRVNGLIDGRFIHGVCISIDGVPWQPNMYRLAYANELLGRR